MTPAELARMAEVLDGLRASPAVASEPLVRRALKTAADLLRREAQRQERHEPPAR